ncbi:MAG: hypothetical protein K2R98_08215 [Gemmataceae bacterium]|nr:hypothetical protein [Gemmataceae bacterium]
MNPVNAGHDITVDGVAFSMKTEAGASISATHLKISKFMEARWIRECKTGVDFHRGMAKLLKHLSHYQRIIVLRVFHVTEPVAGVRYDLVEIPHRLLSRVSTLNPVDFSPRRVSGTSRATVKLGGQDAFHVRLDGSVEKVTIDRLDIQRCRPHASWTVENPLAEIPDTQDEDV